VSQKGVDLSVQVLERLLSEGHDIQFVCLGSGEPGLEQDLRRLQAHFPDKVAVTIGYDEGLSHQIEAGADAFLMPSRFEPCGLNQMYSLRYGTLPIVRNTGGLADTVVDATDKNCSDGVATGFKFDEANVDALYSAMQRVMESYQDQALWQQKMVTAMTRDNSWDQSANAYIEMYHQIIKD
jgi:starch synthase